ncbi:MAG: hypothetical protein AAFW64_00610 [Pseudomonadota bacterium]
MKYRHERGNGMLTLTQDWIMTGNVVVEHARCGDLEVFAYARATCVLAETMLRRGLAADTNMTLLRADPWLFPAPHRIVGVSLATVSVIDFFQTCPRQLQRELQDLANFTITDV